MLVCIMCTCMHKIGPLLQIIDQSVQLIQSLVIYGLDQFVDLDFI